LLYDYAVAGDLFRGAYFETDYASFIAWRDGFSRWRPSATAFSLVPCGGADGGFLLGVMNSNVNAGKIYFPAGTPEPNDIVAKRSNSQAASAARSPEETGLSGRLRAGGGVLRCPARPISRTSGAAGARECSRAAARASWRTLPARRNRLADIRIAPRPGRSDRDAAVCLDVPQSRIDSRA